MISYVLENANIIRLYFKSHTAYHMLITTDYDNSMTHQRITVSTDYSHGEYVGIICEQGSVGESHGILYTAPVHIRQSIASVYKCKRYEILTAVTVRDTSGQFRLGCDAV